ncbi:Cytochrome c oxidase assembly protein cox20, mitochondrial [Cladochytrium tenue]|nr:Cytochrome c oxidase assembly protein cox20, mitochondrial [Cladochytrium tenue]
MPSPTDAPVDANTAATGSPVATSPASARVAADFGVPFDPARPPSYADGIKSVRLQDLRLDRVARMPCARDALLYGIGTGLAVGSARFLASRRPRSAGNWAIATFALTTLASWEVCRLQRRVVQVELERVTPK